MLMGSHLHIPAHTHGEQWKSFPSWKLKGNLLGGECLSVAAKPEVGRDIKDGEQREQMQEIESGRTGQVQAEAEQTRSVRQCDTVRQVAGILKKPGSAWCSPQHR